MQKALIYCRVSSERQVREGSGLKSQRHLCTQYARANNYQIEGVYEERGISGGSDFTDRPAMMELLRYLDDHPNEKYVVIFDDLKRFARDTMLHIQLKREFQSRGATLKCPTFNFEDTPENEFIEIVLAAQGTLERKQNARQVFAKMKARMQAGFWVFQAPFGYTFSKQKFKGSVMHIAPEGQLVKRALEGYASGRLVYITDVLKFFKAHGISRKKSAVGMMLRNRLYTGYISYPRWNIPILKAQHSPLISVETFERIQERLKKNEGNGRITDNDAFPLRRKINCAICGKLMTGSKFHGRSAKYSLYTCHNAECTAKPKYIQKDKLEDAYRQVLEKTRLKEEVIPNFRIMAQHAWNFYNKISISRHKQIQDEIKEVEKRIRSLVEKIVNTNNPLIIQRYEEELAKLESELAELRVVQNSTSPPDFEAALESFISSLRTVSESWEKGDLITKNAIHHMVFGNNPSYSEKTGFRTADFPHRLRLFWSLDQVDFQMVEGSVEKFEPILGWILGKSNPTEKSHK